MKLVGSKLYVNQCVMNVGELKRVSSQCFDVLLPPLSECSSQPQQRDTLRRKSRRNPLNITCSAANTHRRPSDFLDFVRRRSKTVLKKHIQPILKL